MSHTVSRLPRRFLLPVGLAAVVGCGGDLTLPDSSGAGVELSLFGGDSQTGTVGERLPLPIVVRVETVDKQPIGGKRVAFVLSSPASGAGKVDPDTAVTDSEGRASTTWVLGTTPGDYQGEARLVTTDSTQAPAVPFSASARAGAPDTIRAVSPLTQPGRRDQELDDPLVVAVVDRYGNPVPGATVFWSVTSGGGSLSAEETTTASDGTASVVWTLGSGIGIQKAAATIDGATGSPVTFTAAVLF
ncbi:MAG: Ig-like domain-containing protein [Gemmatimonadales bacterium]